MANPGLANVLVPLAAVVGVLATAFGGVLLILPQLVKGFQTVIAIWKVFSTALTTSPIGLIITAIGLLIAAGIALYQNWDTITEFFKTSWEQIKIAFATAIQFLVNTVLLPFVEMVTKEIGLVMTGVGKLVGVFDKDLGDSILGIADKFMNAREHITNWTDSVVDVIDQMKGERKFQDFLEDYEKKNHEILSRIIKAQESHNDQSPQGTQGTQEEQAETSGLFTTKGLESYEG